MVALVPADPGTLRRPLVCSGAPHGHLGSCGLPSLHTQRSSHVPCITFVAVLKVASIWQLCFILCPRQRGMQMTLASIMLERPIMPFLLACLALCSAAAPALRLCASCAVTKGFGKSLSVRKDWGPAAHLLTPLLVGFSAARYRQAPAHCQPNHRYAQQRYHRSHRSRDRLVDGYGVPEQLWVVQCCVACRWMSRSRVVLWMCS